MTQEPQQAQHDLIERALSDPRIAAAVQAYDAVRPFVPENNAAPAVASYAAHTTVTSLPRA